MKKLKSQKIFGLFIAAIILSLLLEILGFQMDDFLLKWKGPEPITLDLSTFHNYDEIGILVLPEDSECSLSDLAIPCKNVTVTLTGPSNVYWGNISICDEANRQKSVSAARFLVNPGGDANTFTTRLNSHGNLTRLKISFENQEDPLWITDITFNQSHIQFSWGRILLFFFIISLILLIIKYKIYQKNLDLNRTSHKLLSLGVLSPCLVLAFLILFIQTPSHYFLRPIPFREETDIFDTTILFSDIYSEQLAAFEKGQINLDLYVDPRLAEMDTPYDRGVRDANGIIYFWDHVFYNGLYYSYYGLAPLFMIYYPVYWLTGMAPTVYLCQPILTIFAILGVYFALNGLIRYFRIRANLLLYLLGIPALMGGAMLFMMETSDSIYYYTFLSAAGWLGFFLACTFYACYLRTGFSPQTDNISVPKSLLKSNCFPRLLFFGAGVSVVMLVLSRPNQLLLAIAFSSPAYLQILLQKQRFIKQRLLDAFSFLIPVIAGGAMICWYNYLRFDSIIEFGATYQLTESNIHYNQLIPSLHHFKEMLYHYFIEPFDWHEFFPFISLTSDTCSNFGNYLYYDRNAGLFNLPLNLGILLTGYSFLNKSKKAPIQKTTYALVFGGIFMLGYIDFLLAGVIIRYVADLAVVASLLSLLLILEHVSFSRTESGHMVYSLFLIILIITILIGIFMIFSNETNTIQFINPDFFIQTAQFLHN